MSQIQKLICISLHKFEFSRPFVLYDIPAYILLRKIQQTLKTLLSKLKILWQSWLGQKTKIQIFTPSSWKCKLLVSKSETPLICANLMMAIEMKSQVAWHDNVELFSEMCSLISWAVTTAVQRFCQPNIAEEDCTWSYKTGSSVERYYSNPSWKICFFLVKT